ncbi:type VI secretion system-associated FHA domain protein TagH [uncultured Azohydromonas sp.]|jgi:type VI secretion system FHA domain protein|uniref:type VI secretion system-associated FHA domain protein TagH n=1 Tax=uncultured Azohydromonas sp. TaxID=487342 RepID=UPI002627273B|nr:type VI secretion system-associated FHA domain protein TagH [uncultured Azohydromonas sp.]
MLIRVLSHGGQPLPAPSAARFDAAGGFIGRGIDCTLVLPDAQRLMSRRHAQVSWREGRFFIRQLGANLALEVDGRPLGLEAEVPLAPGMSLRIGAYLMETEDDSAEAVAPQALPDHAAPAPVPAPALPPALSPAAASLLPAAPVTPVPAARPSAFSEVLGEGAAPPAEVGAPAPMVPAAGTPPADPTAAALLAALYAGLEMPVPPAPTPQETNLVGRLLHAAIGGLLQLLAARHVAKRELGAAGTRLQTRENNALKFSPDVDTALAHLLGPARRGFIPPLAAVREAFEDVRTHEIALLAGLRAALDAQLARLAPQALEEQRHARGGWSAPLDVWRKAQLWDRYCELHAQALAELQEQTDPFSARAFLEAYEAQREKLSRQPGGQ